MEHTALPWMVLGPRSDGKRFIKQEGRRTSLAIATTDYDTHGANAAFIVRAVNNHAALLSALEALRLWLLGDRDINKMNGLMDQARAAIAAAKGEAND